MTIRVRQNILGDILHILYFAIAPNGWANRLFPTPFGSSYSCCLLLWELLRSATKGENTNDPNQAKGIISLQSHIFPAALNLNCANIVPIQSANIKVGVKPRLLEAEKGRKGAWDGNKTKNPHQFV